MAAAVLLEHLTRRFGAFKAVDDLSLEVREGEIFGFLGSNGAGKSTAIRMMCGLLTPTSGRAIVLGVDPARDPEAVKPLIGYMSQKFSLYDDLSVRQNLTFFGGVYGLSDAAIAEREAWAIHMAGLEGKEEATTGSLPGGWKQRLALACSVLHRPRLLFLDEPTGGVDPISRRRFWTMIREMAAAGVTVLVTTHYMDEAEQCGRIAFMHAGRLIALGTLAELKSVFDRQGVLEVQCPRFMDALDILEKQEWVLENSVFGDRVHIVVPDAESCRARVLELLHAQGNEPAAVRRIAPSLEDAFIHYIGEASP